MQNDELEKAYLLLQQGSYTDAEKLLIRLRNAGHAGYVSLYLAFLYLNRQDKERDVKKAKELFQEAAAHGIRAAQYNLGHLLMTEQQYAEAKYWLSQAAKSGDPAAMYQLYRIYQLGHMDIVDREMAITHLRQSANAAFPHALRELHRLEMIGEFGVWRSVIAVILLPYRAIRTIKLLTAQNRDERFKSYP